ncbi:hypothetical protein T459_26393 [Capsicum annuum]|uniref:Induced stolon tip protein LRP n=1 Tax=Capsicum annuum TaxID=4072 RepID=Q6RJX7_CAPAN|nr:induced stolon tip protein LRP [Capsicum annuum]PHT71289.1 hypothetical protein T459_26393 [Capsicum annuum]
MATVYKIQGAFLKSCVFLGVVLVLAVSVKGNSEGDALYALRRSLSDPDNVLQSWDPNLVNPCTWFHVTCNGDNQVTRVFEHNPRLEGPELLGLASYDTNCS